GPAVTPAAQAPLAEPQQALARLGFRCRRLPFGDPEVNNLYAEIGSGRPNFCFAGHTDVVPPGPADAWAIDPFAGTVRDGVLHGRGAADMKAAIAAFVTAAAGFLTERGTDGFAGRISLLVTGDEEGPATDGTVRVLEWLKAQGE